MTTAGDTTKSIGTALITGAGRRIGKTLALDLARQGWRIGVHYHRSGEQARDVVARIEAAGGTAAAIQGNLSDPADIDRLVPDCAVALGAVTCLINNASVFQYDDAGSLGINTWKTHHDVNLMAPVFLAKAFAAALPKGETGSIVNLIDQRILRLSPDFFSYTISKAALWTATQTLAQSLAPHIRVNAIAPGPVLQSIHQTEADFAEERRSTLLGRGASTDEIAAAVRFILDAPSMTGQMIAIDGGQHLAIGGGVTAASSRLAALKGGPDEP